MAVRYGAVRSAERYDSIFTVILSTVRLVHIIQWKVSGSGSQAKSISGRVDRASATEAVDTGSIPGRVKPKTIKIGIHSFPAWRSAIKGAVWSLHRVW